MRLERAVAVDAHLWVILAYTAVAGGCVLRLLRFVDNPALWLDEALLAINITDKSFSGILGPLEFVQSAPVGFLLAEKVAETIIGDGEQSLRLFPLVAALASVFLFAFIARRVLLPPTAAFAILAFVTGEPLLERAAEVKPYSVDVAVAALLIALAVWALDVPNRGLGRVAALGAAGVVVIWFSFPAVFVIAAAVAAVAIRAWEARSWRLLIGASVAGAATAVTFAAAYAIASSNVTRVSLAIFGGGQGGSAPSYEGVRNAWSLFVNPLGFDNGRNGLAALLACFGVIAFARRASLDRLALFTLPAVLAFGADLFGRYPLGGRFSIFLVPALLVLVARGGQAVVMWSRRPLLVATGLALFLVAPSLGLAGQHALDAPARQDMRPLLEHLIRQWQDDDALYVYAHSQNALRYYSTCEDCSPPKEEYPWPTRLAPIEPDNPDPQALESVPGKVIIGREPGNPLVDLDRLRAAGRVWLLFSHIEVNDGIDDEQALVRALESEKKLLEAVHARGARLYLFDGRAPNASG